MKDIQAILDQEYIADSVSLDDIPEDVVLIREPSVQLQTGLSHTGLYERIQDKTFPPNISLGGRSRAWIQSDVSLWNKKRIAISKDKEAQEAEQQAEQIKAAQRRARRNENQEVAAL
jgi:prophage regulatory protein